MKIDPATIIWLTTHKLKFQPDAQSITDLMFCPYGLHMFMFTISRTRDYADWIKTLKDFRAQARIADRIDRLAAGNPGDVRPVGEGVSELRIIMGLVSGLFRAGRAGRLCSSLWW
jgi:hypothetical protein